MIIVSEVAPMLETSYVKMRFVSQVSLLNVVGSSISSHRIPSLVTQVASTSTAQSAAGANVRTSSALQVCPSGIIPSAVAVVEYVNPSHMSMVSGASDIETDSPGCRMVTGKSDVRSTMGPVVPGGVMVLVRSIEISGAVVVPSLVTM